MFANYFDVDSSEAMWVYTILMIVSFFLGHIYQKTKSIALKRITFSLSYFLLSVFYIFSKSGTDYVPYVRMFKYFKDLQSCTFSSEIEYGYQLINVLFNFFTSNPIYGICFIKFLIITLFFRGIFLFREKVSISYVLMAYVAVLYLQSFNVIRMSFACSIVVLSYYYIPINIKKALLLAVTSYFFHRSAIFYLLFIFYYYIIKELFPSIKKRILILGTIAINLVVVISAIGYGEEIIMSGFAGGRYEHYFNDVTQTSVGLGFFITFIPQIYILYRLMKIHHEKDLIIMNLIFVVFGISVYFLGYQLFILARANCYFILPSIFLLAYYHKMSEKRKNTFILSTFLFIYWYLRFLLDANALFLDAGVDKIMLI